VSKPAKPAAISYYLDADVLGLAKLLAQIRSDVTYPGDPGGPVKGGRWRSACVITDTATPDAVWIPETARQGWLIVTRDRHIQEHRAEIAAVRDAGARMVTLISADATDTFHQLEVLMSQWRRLELLCKRPGPFIVAASRTSFKEVPLS
jgi:PIN like domain